MQIFACQGCNQTVFFESVQCTKCGRRLGYLPDRQVVSALEPDGEFWRSTDKDPRRYRLCRNQVDHNICNWTVVCDDEGDSEFCRACRLNHMIPNLDKQETLAAWQRMEVAKRRLLYTLYQLNLPVESKAQNAEGGVQFDFLQDPGVPDQPKVLTGHADGVITINVAEADDPFREKTRLQLGETYRTLLGHFRHEIGHYYWDRLIKNDGRRLSDFRALFGDESADYAEAQKRHYSEGAPTDWLAKFVSAYASMHPWEDWAETWAHYLHIFDTLETARAHGVSLRPSTESGKVHQPSMIARRLDPHSFEDMIHGWLPLTQALNNLNRSMGLHDVYPFVLSEAAVTKLRFVHDVVSASWVDEEAAA